MEVTSQDLSRAHDDLRVAVFGAAGGIGSALVEQLLRRDDVTRVIALSRQPTIHRDLRVLPIAFDIEDEQSIAQAARDAATIAPLDLVVVASGYLHQPDLGPEKRLQDLSAHRFARSFAINATGPALIAKHFLPLMTSERSSVFASLSARVGSISDNRSGGWHAYRASKAAHNMIIKTLSIEQRRRNPRCIVVGLHPGTVDTSLSRPFQANVPAHRLFTPEYAAARLLDVIDGLESADSGRCFDHRGDAIDP